MQLTSLPSKQIRGQVKQGIRRAIKAPRKYLVPELTYQTTSIEGEDFQNKINNAFNLLFEVMTKTDVHKYN